MTPDVLVGPALAMAGGIVALWIQRATQRRRALMWLKAARACGVTDLRPSEITGSTFKVRGSKGVLDVELSSYKRGKGARGVRITVSGLPAVSDLGLRPENVATTIMKTLGTREVEVGDPQFDERFLIEGPTPRALAVLDAATRKQVSDALGGLTVVNGTGGSVWLKAEAHLANGRLSVEMPESWHVKLEPHFAGALQTILDVAANLSVPRDVPHQLAENALHDPVWAVRLTNLKTLAREYPGSTESVRALHAACADAYDEIRLAAASAVGRDGEDTLLQLAFEKTDDDIAARAVEALGDRLPVARALEALGTAIEARRFQAALALVDALGQHTPDADVATVEPRLIAVLEHPHERLGTVAARALGRMGTVAAVLPLQEAAPRIGSEGRTACRQAVASIQSRAKGATPGQLSVAAGEGGQVTLAEKTGGELSPAGED